MNDTAYVFSVLNTIQNFNGDLNSLCMYNGIYDVDERLFFNECLCLIRNTKQDLNDKAKQKAQDSRAKKLRR